MKFEELGIRVQLLEALGYMGFENATPIQELAIPLILKGRDILASAQTGTGKTGAFVIPTIDLLCDKADGGTQVLIVVPTRELALQIEMQIQGFSYYADVSSIALYGGGSGDEWEIQKKALKSGVNVIVATPGKLISFLQQGIVKTKNIKHLILDEADRMLDIGFYDDILMIIKKLPVERQTLMFSATMPSKIKGMANKILSNPEFIGLSISKPAAGVLQIAYLVHDHQKSDLIAQLIKDRPKYKSIIIFSSTKKNVAIITEKLRRNKINASSISSSLEQKERESVLQDFRAKKIRVLVATDVISRGIDIKDINLVVNYDVPNDAEDYVHRIGRTARADTTGVALTFINEDDMRSFANIEKLIEAEVKKLNVPASFGESPKWEPFKKKRDNRRHQSKGRGKRRFSPRKRK